jgi:acyl-CoA thioesterase
MTNLTHKAVSVFAQDLYATEATGISIEEVRTEYAKCAMTIMPHHRNAMGGVMGGVFFTLADLAFAAASNSHCLEEDSPLAWVSLGSSIQYLAQPKGNRLIPETQCVRQGRNTCVYNIMVHDENGINTAIVTTTGLKMK